MNKNIGFVIIIMSVVLCAIWVETADQFIQLDLSRDDDWSLTTYI